MDTRWKWLIGAAGLAATLWACKYPYGPGPVPDIAAQDLRVVLSPSPGAEPLRAVSGALVLAPETLEQPELLRRLSRRLGEGGGDTRAYVLELVPETLTASADCGPRLPLNSSPRILVLQLAGANQVLREQLALDTFVLDRKETLLERRLSTFMYPTPVSRPGVPIERPGIVGSSEMGALCEPGGSVYVTRLSQFCQGGDCHPCGSVADCTTFPVMSVSSVRIFSEPTLRNPIESSDGGVRSDGGIRFDGGI
jgi:hypothetical protein